MANCIPNPTQSDTPTVCEGEETNGLIVNRDKSTVTVKSGATVSGPEAAIRVELFDNTAGFQFGTETSSITIEAGASVNGLIGIDLVPSFSQKWLTVELSNVGVITGSSGIALRAASDAGSRFSSLYNGPTGVIAGGIRGQVSSFLNEGLLDGGTITAYEDAPNPAYNGQGTVMNNGTIRSTSSSATINLFRAFNPDEHVTNSGLIENLGTGAAINGAGGFTTLSNAATGVIKAEQIAITGQTLSLTNHGTVRANDAALRAENALTLINTGTIIGDVRATPAYSGFTSIIDNRGGRIDGDVILGMGDDLLIADLAAANPYGEITGILDAGDGLDTIRYVAGTTMTISQAPTLPTSFERIDLRLENDGTVLTLADTVKFTTGISVSGDGEGNLGFSQKLISKATIETAGPALVTTDFNSRGLEIVNEGTIKATLATPDDWGVRISRDTGFHNIGTVTVTGGNGVFAADYGTMINDGSIIASGTALKAEREFENAGLIRSTAGVGLSFYGQDYSYSENSGTIEGVTAGVAIERGGIANSGTIRASSGPGVHFIGAAALINEASGVISAASGPAIIANFGARIVNKGTINGDVSLMQQPYQTNNVYVAAAGSMLNGNLDLGNGGDLFITSLVNTGPGEYAGVTGTVTGSGEETIRYLVDQNSAATLATSGIFSQVGYELVDGATLTLSADQTWTSGVHFSGTGSVDMDVDITVDGGTTASLLDLRAQSYLEPTVGGIPPLNAVSIVSRGDITHVANGSFYDAATVSMAGGSTFENDGTIITRNLAPYYSLATVMGGGTVINNGTILLDASTAVMGSFFGSEPRQLDVINTGTIQQIGDSGFVSAVANGTSLVNSGLIDVGYVAVHLTDPGFNQSSVLRNSGTIRSRNDVAVSSGRTAMINEATGYIESAPGRPAVVLGAGSSLDNAGSIQGDVWMNSNSNLGNAYIARGGTVTGNLTFGQGNDLLVLMGDESGVSGTIDGGMGVDSVVRLYDTSQTINLAALPALPLNFEGHGYGAIGVNTTLTMTGPADGISNALAFLGDGTIINRVNVKTSGSASASNAVRLGFSTDIPDLATSVAFVNEATLEDGVLGEVRSFTNHGQISSGVILQTSVGETFSFLNQGSIAGGLGLRGDELAQSLETATIRNEGQVGGSVYISLIARDFRFENVGTMSETPLSPYTSSAPTIRVGMPFNLSPNDVNAQRAVFSNSGTMADGFLVQAAADVLQFVNSGTIGQAGDIAVYLSGEAHRLPVNGVMVLADQTSASFSNSGQINGVVTVATHAKSLTSSNSGSILVAARQDDGPHESLAALGITNATVADSAVTFGNSGSIADANAGHRAVEVRGESDGKAVVSVMSSGSIAADGGAVVMRDPSNPDSPDLLSTAAALAVSTTRSDAPSSIEVVNAAGGRLSATGLTVKGNGPNDSVPAGLENGGSVALYASSDTVRIVNSGVIAGRAGGTLPSGISVVGLTSVTESFLAGAIQTEDSVDTLINNATGVITGSINLGARNDRLENAGRIEGDVYLGSGDDVAVIRTGAVFTGTLYGGDGSDRIELATSSTYATPTEIEAGRFVGFERLTNSAGVNAYSGALATNVDVNGGYLIGRAGSLLTGNVAVGSGARFGSAGTVTGNIVVASGGELAPGASPGTMTVNGTVSLNSGSTTIFELAPSGPSDRLIVNGALIIAPGATLNLTGDRALLPGMTYDLFTATTLTGNFSTITQSGAIQGLVRNSANGLSLTATVVAPSSGDMAGNSAIGYVNNLILAGEASPALIAALPSLLGPDGRASAQAFARISAEAYASASQLGVEHGLALARAGREGLAVAPGDGSGPFTFAQGMGTWRTLKANGTLGTARATNNSTGVLGGLGLARDGSSVGAFVGYLDGRQNIAALEARTDLDGVVAGVSGHLVSDSFSASATFAYQWGDANMRRTVGGAAATSVYRLRTASFDLSAGYDLAIGDQWSVRPNAGFTYVSALRGDASESGSGAFGLAVDRARLKASFIDGGITLRAMGKIRPWLNLGVRHQLSGERTVASAAFLGETIRFSSPGATRKLTQILTAAGLTAPLTERLELFGSFSGEFGNGTGQAVSGGLRYIF